MKPHKKWTKKEQIKVGWSLEEQKRFTWAKKVVKEHGGEMFGPTDREIGSSSFDGWEGDLINQL